MNTSHPTQPVSVSTSASSYPTRPVSVSTTASAISRSSPSSSPAIQSLPSLALFSINTSLQSTSTTTTYSSLTNSSSTPPSSTLICAPTSTSTSQSFASRSLVITVPSLDSSTRFSTSDISPPASMNVNAPSFLPPPPQTKKTRQTQNQDC